MVATPIGNLEDVTERALRVLRSVDRIACEDTRVTRRLCDAWGVAAPLLRHEAHNEAASTEGILALLAGGHAVALVSDAGTPAVNDPGQRLVQHAREAGHTVRTVPGPSALTAALSGSGLPADRVVFHGFVPKRRSDREALWRGLEAGTHVLFQPARDLAETADELHATRPGTELVVARELTKQHESWYRGPPEALREVLSSAEAQRGEAVVLIRVPEAGPADDDAVRDAVRRHLDAGHPRKEAAARAARELGVGKRRAYQLSLDDEGEAG